MLSAYARHLLEQLRDLNLVVEGKTRPVIEILKRTPRSGKSVRIKNYGLDLPKRSVYDHIISLPAQAEFFLSISKADVDHQRLASMLVFHDLSEAVTGDVPRFKSKEIASDTYLTEEEKKNAELKANQLLFDALNPELKDLFVHYLENHHDRSSFIYRFFHMVDKTDPIIAIWRYIFLFKKKIDIDRFLSAMSDFFLYPETQNSCFNKQVLSLVRDLQNPKNAKNYYLNTEHYFERYSDEHLRKNLKVLIENQGMHFVSCELPAAIANSQT